MADRQADPLLEYLVRGILLLQTPDECRSFLYDLCTESELQEMSRRLQAAKMLRNGRIYADIAEETGLSTATISRVNRCLKYAPGGGYITVLERLEKEARRR
ncbi:MAG: helix-turn-helix domain-containing protein [Clostridia bacterium]|nr:helix-turn-helix domain-containing protein [Clostridia bacterium]